MDGSRHEYTYADKKQERKKIVRSFAWNSVATVFFWSAYISIFNLQSSINVEDGLGTNTFAAGYYAMSIFSIVVAPAMMEKLGAKKCLVICDCSSFLFVLANFYPKYFTLLPATVTMLLLQCAGFPSMSMLNILYANLYSAITGKSREYYTIRFSGYFFTALQCSQVFGSFLAYVVLYGFNQSPLPSDDSSANCSISTNSSCEIDEDRFQYCGINDCQNATLIEKYLNQYKLVDQVPLYVLLGSAILMEIIATLIHIFLVPSDEIFKRKTKYFEQEMALMGKNEETDTSVTPVKKNHGVLDLMISSLKGVGRHACQLQFLLLMPITFYGGMAMSFVFSEVTRSFSSCVLGVQWVGICMALYGTFDAIFSWVVGQFGRKINRSVLFVVTICLECGNYIYCLFWSMSPNALPSVCVIFCLFGTTDGILQTIVNVTHIDMFPKKREIGLVAWNSTVTLGMSTGMLLSRMLCVRERIYLNLGIAVLGTILLVIADVRHRRKKGDNNESTIAT